MLLQGLRALRKDRQDFAVCFPMTLLNMMASPEPPLRYPPGIEPRLGFDTNNFLSFYTLKNLVHAGFDERIIPI